MPGTASPFVGDVTKIHMGPASITYKGRNLGYTLNDSVQISITQTTTPITPDQASLPVKDIITGTEVSVAMTLAEVNSSNLALVPGGDAAGFKDAIGVDMKALADELIIVALDSSNNDVWSLPKCAPYISGPIQFIKTTPQGLQLTFKGYTDSAGYFLYFEQI
jgi:hypothetical protein